MAWIEAADIAQDPIRWEQGIDGDCTFELFSDAGQTQPWPFPGWDVNSILTDSSQRKKYTLQTTVNTTGGIVTVIAPESLLNSLKTTKQYFLNVIMIAPGNTQADDHHLAFVPVTILKRTARRDP